MMARRDYKAKRKPAGGFSGWMGVICGLGLGLAVAGVVYLKDRHSESPTVQSAKAGKKRPHGGEQRSAEVPDAETGDSGAPEEPAKSYDFYSMLPKFEVVVPEKDKEVKPDIRGVPETRRGTYVLQAGSYKSFADADRVRAQLALQGVESKVQKVSVDNDTWHRIRIGPVSKLEELNRLRALLRRADVDVLVIRVGD
jgi:cell division protein FtsN